MSLNVCTDQLVLEIADPDQIVSLSNLSSDPRLSFLHDEAAKYPKNSGLAEEVFLAHPDIVVTGTYSLHNTALIVQKAGIPVEQFEYAQTLDTIAGDILRMGKILHHEDRAKALAEDFKEKLRRFRAMPRGKRPSAVVFEQNGVALGAGTLADSVLDAAGFRNLVAQQGYSGMVPYPLELLVRDKPDVVLVTHAYEKTPSLADEIARHPAIRALGSDTTGNVVPPGSWACGGAFTIEAVEALRRLRDTLSKPQEQFQQKCIAVLRPELRKGKEMEHLCDSGKTRSAPGGHAG